ncbi:hypothetical protein EVB32_009 [Rhizobium phage RHph_TM39]|nr:hypothetical protein EVB32_009 [Rhizobium phage RHph_TM39]
MFNLTLAKFVLEAHKSDKDITSRNGYGGYNIHKESYGFLQKIEKKFGAKSVADLERMIKKEETRRKTPVPDPNPIYKNQRARYRLLRDYLGNSSDLNVYISSQEWDVDDYLGQGWVEKFKSDSILHRWCWNVMKLQFDLDALIIKVRTHSNVVGFEKTNEENDITWTEFVLGEQALNKYIEVLEIRANRKAEREYEEHQEYLRRLAIEDWKREQLAKIRLVQIRDDVKDKSRADKRKRRVAV